MKQNGGWFEFDSYQSAFEFCLTDREGLEYWQPCKACKTKLAE